jgi:hypothetical protein
MSGLRASQFVGDDRVALVDELVALFWVGLVLRLDALAEDFFQHCWSLCRRDQEATTVLALHPLSRNIA